MPTKFFLPTYFDIECQGDMMILSQKNVTKLLHIPMAFKSVLNLVIVSRLVKSQENETYIAVMNLTLNQMINYH